MHLSIGNQQSLWTTNLLISYVLIKKKKKQQLEFDMAKNKLEISIEMALFTHFQVLLKKLSFGLGETTYTSEVQILISINIKNRFPNLCHFKLKTGK